MMKRCIECLCWKQIDQFNKEKARKDGYQNECRICANKRSTKYRREVRGILPLSENKECGAYLGVVVAERLVRHLFNDVQTMPYRNIGFDFICSKDKKIDVKSACITMNNTKYPFWRFAIRKNQIADYFLLLAFDNRTDLEPQHQWLIPAHVLNHIKSTSISPSTIHKWDKYKQPIVDAQICCNNIRNGNG